MMKKEKLAVIQGTLELLILKTLGRGGEMHGFEILEWIDRATDGKVVVEEGALYPALHRMQRRAWLRAEWAVSKRGRRAKYYVLSAAGKRALTSEELRWGGYVAAMEQLSNA